jgi:thermitase
MVSLLFVINVMKKALAGGLSVFLALFVVLQGTTVVSSQHAENPLAPLQGDSEESTASSEPPGPLTGGENESALPSLNKEEALRALRQQDRSDRATALRESLLEVGASEEAVIEILRLSESKGQRIASEQQKEVIEVGFIDARYFERKVSSDDSESESESFSRASLAASKRLQFAAGRVLIEVSMALSASELSALELETGTDIEIKRNGDKYMLVARAQQGQSTADLLPLFFDHGSLDAESVQPDFVFKRALVPNDTSFSSQWSHLNDGSAYNGFVGVSDMDMDNDEAWDIFTGNGSTPVALIDSGIHLGHEDLVGNFWDSSDCVDYRGVNFTCEFPGFDFLYSITDSLSGDYTYIDGNPFDEETHGTNIAGIIGAKGDNGVGLAGINWEAEMMALKVGTLLFDDGRPEAEQVGFYPSDIVDAINFAVHNGARVLNLSIEGPLSASFETALTFARDNGVLVVAAAGNDTLDLDAPGNDVYPCEFDLDNILCVASVSPNGSLSTFSNFGQIAVDVAAPGEEIFTTRAGQRDLYYEDFEDPLFELLVEYDDEGTGDWAADIEFIGSENDVLFTHNSGVYVDEEDTLLAYQSSFDLQPFENGLFLFEMECTVNDALDGNGRPEDGVEVMFSSDGGLTFDGVIAHNGVTLSNERLGFGVNNRKLVMVPLDAAYLSSDAFTFGFRFFSNDDGLTNFGCLIDEVTLRVEGNSEYAFVDGTSFAVPQVVGVASLIWDYAPQLSYTQVRNILMQSDTDLLGLSTSVVSGGLLNTHVALQNIPGPAVSTLAMFQEQGGVSVEEGGVVNPTPYFTWSDPIGEGIIDHYEYQLDGGVMVSTVGNSAQLVGVAAGAHTFSISAVNTAGTAGIAGVFSFTVDDVAPDAPTNVVMNGGNGINSTTDELAVSLVSDPLVESGTLRVTVNSVLAPGFPKSVNAGDTELGPVDVSGVADGNVVVGVVFRNFIGNNSQVEEFFILKDTVVAEPVILVHGGNVIISGEDASVVLSGTNPSAEEVFVVDARFTDESGNTVVALSRQDAPISVVAFGEFQFTEDLSGFIDGVISAFVTVADAAGNEASVQYDSGMDRVVDAFSAVVPAGGINASNAASTVLEVTSSELGNVSITFTSGVSTVIVSEAVLGAGIESFTYDLSGLSDGVVTLEVEFVDESGNSSLQSFSLIKDVVLNAYVVTLNNGVPINSNSVGAVSLDVTVDEPGTANATFLVSTSPVAPLVFDSIALVSGTNSLGPFDLSSLGDGVVELNFYFTDVAENSLDTVIFVVKEVGLASVALSINEGNTINAAGVSLVDFELTASEAGTADIIVSDSGTNSITLEDIDFSTAATITSSLDLSTFVDGVVTFAVVFEDVVGNITNEQTIGLLDTQVSGPSDVELNGGLIVNAVTVSSVPLAFIVSEDGVVSFSFAGIDDVSIVAGVQLLDLDLSGEAEGVLAGTMIFTDTAGNVSGSVEIVGAIDITVPDAATEVVLNSGNAIDGAVRSAVGLVFEVLEDDVDVEYVISSDSQADEVSGRVHADTAGVVNVTGVDLSGFFDGVLTATVVVIDSAGNRSLAAFANADVVENPVPVVIAPSVNRGRGGGASVSSSRGTGRSTRGNNRLNQLRAANAQDPSVAGTSTSPLGSGESNAGSSESGDVALTRSERLAVALRERRENGLVRSSEPFPVPVPFEDVVASSSVGRAVSVLFSRGAVQGHESGEFRPDESINRISAYAILMRLKDLDKGTISADVPFTDFFPNAWFASLVSSAWELNLTSGFPDGEFKPNTLVRRSEMLAMIFKVMGVEVDETDKALFIDVPRDVWYSPVFAKAHRLGLLENNIFAGPMDFVSRGEFAETVVKVLEVVR